MKVVWPSVVRHVTVVESVELPPMEEVIVDVYVDRHENQEEEENRLLVEMHPNPPEVYGCVLAPSMVDGAICTMMPVPLFNPHNYLVVIRQDSVVRQEEPV